MKKHINIRLIGTMAFLLLGIGARAQYHQEVPGDNFSLEGALELFKKSETPEQFERMLNDPDSRVNNLDLNGDGYIDYIRVENLFESNIHIFVIQAVISPTEKQDIAIITLEKRANGKAILQITGDEDIYGVETIIEPTQEVYTYAGSQSSRVTVNVWSWPMVRHVYSPYYQVWVSPWHWNYRPYWYRPWRPIIYHDYYTYWRPFRRHYTICYAHRVVYAPRIYRPRRTTSLIVYNNHYHNVANYRSRYISRSGQYKNSNRPDRRSVSKSVRYDASGRIQTRTSRSSDAQVSRSRSSNGSSNQRGTISRSSYPNQQRSSAASKIRSKHYEHNTNNGRSRVSVSESKSRNARNTSGGSSRSHIDYEAQPRSSGSSIGSSSRSSSNSSRIQRSGGSSSSSRSSVQRSTGSSSSRSSVQRQSSSSRSSGGSSYQRSNGNRSSSIQRSSSSSKVRRSSGSSPSRSSSSINRSSSRSSSPKSSSSRSSSSRSSSSSKRNGRH